MELRFTLSYPPSTNRIWRRSGTRIYLNPIAKRYREEVLAVTFGMPKFGNAEVTIELKLFPADLRRRDLDNAAKSLLDALKHVQIINDDSQVKKLVMEMCEIRVGGAVEVLIKEYSLCGRSYA